MAVIETEGLTKFYGDVRGIEDVTGEVEAGEVFAFLGPNELAAVLVVGLLITTLGSLLSGAGLSFTRALAGFANVWPLALLFAALGIVVTGWSLRTTVVTGSVAGILVAMYVADLVGRLDTSLDWIRYGSVFRYYGQAIEEGIDPLAFIGVTAVAVALAALGALLFGRRDLSS